MSFTGGDLIEATYNHPTVGSGTIYLKSGEDIQVNYGGYTSDDDDAGVTGDGQMIDKMTRKRWFVSTTVAWDMTEKDELEKLQAMQDNPVLADWTFAHIVGKVWAGRGKPVGDLNGAAQDATIPLKVAGGGKLESIS